jgi:hypothetical protein
MLEGSWRSNSGRARCVKWPDMSAWVTIRSLPLSTGGSVARVVGAGRGHGQGRIRPLRFEKIEVNRDAMA